MFSKATIDEIELVARENGFEAASLLAVAEIESGGKAFAFVDGKKEPMIRFEGHYFDRLIAPDKRGAARKAGLAASKWGVVKNPRGQIDRWKMLARAMEIDRGAAIQSVSWGIGQVMGSHWKALGYASPDALMAEARGSIAGQVRLMVRFIRVNKLAGLLAARDWAGFARRYNGPAYKKNQYDTRMAAAYARHRNTKLKRGVAPSVKVGAMLAMGARNNVEKVRDLQRMLTTSGFPVEADGAFGTRTELALRAFQTANGLVVDGIYGPASQAALHDVLPKVGSTGSVVTLLWRLLRIFTFGRWRR